MNETLSPLYQKAFFVVFGCALFAILLQAWIVGTQLDALFIKMGNDSVLRLVTVRNWLGGQPWFDTVEYRLVPPEGTLMHWSRYLDAAIGGLIVLFATFLPMESAEFLAVSVWPTVLVIVLVCIIGFGTKRLFGPLAASGAMLFVLIWPFTSRFYFRAGQIDHHNVQVLMTIIMTMAAVWPRANVRAGILAGFATSVALAVGLETMPYILALGLLMFVRATFRLAPGADRLLTAYCTTLVVSAFLLWIGQTPAARWDYTVCDQLGLPVMQLVAIAGAACLVPIVFGLRQNMLRLLVSLAIVLAGCALAWGTLSACLGGPYGALPLDVQEIIRGSILEAKPAIAFAQSNTLQLIKMAVPVLAALIISFALWAGLPKATPAQVQTSDVVGQLLILNAVGLIAVFFQVRLLSTSAGAAPLLAGFALATLLGAYLKSRAPDDATKLIGATVLILTPFVIETLARPFLPQLSQTSTTQDRNCRSADEIAALAVIDPSVVLSPTNLGPAILLETEHSVLSGPYHRNPAAFANGKIPFQLPEDRMRAYVRDIGAKHLVICRGSYYGEGYASELAKEVASSWLRPIQIEAENVMLFEVLASEPS